MNSDLDLVVALIALFCMVVGTAVVNYKRRHRKFETSNVSVLMTYYTDGVELLPLKSGTIGSMHYTAMATTSGPNTNGALLYRVELPFHSQVHLLGVPKKSGAVQLVPSGDKSIMERVSLEGDYDSYFSLFAEKSMQSQSRYVLDPKAMIFTVEFCQSHNWEILGGDLYFVQATANTSADPTSMSEDIVRFVAEIKPAVATSLTAEEIRLRTPYREERRTDLLCPICQQTLENKQSFLACPSGHGFLVNGGVLAQINRGTITLPGTLSLPATGRDESFTCPSCGHAMKQVAYNSGKTIIDSCNHCPYRWLDAGEQNLNKR